MPPIATVPERYFSIKIPRVTDASRGGTRRLHLEFSLRLTHSYPYSRLSRLPAFSDRSAGIPAGSPPLRRSVIRICLGQAGQVYELMNPSSIVAPCRRPQ